MPRNDQVTRQWILLQPLDRPGGATIEELVRFLPADFACNARTILRDPQALEATFPLYTDRVDGRVCWKLVEGFNRVPAVQFSVTELMAMVFTRDLARPLETPRRWGMPKKRALARPKKKGAVLCKDVREAIERVWPDGVADMTFDADESYFWEIRSQLKRAFERIGKARLLKM
ncbi:MAG: hypothetical protein ABSH28_11285 [Acidobacteriota bacterium]|jgi:predicted DNA-binding transcriptional regulator YafY